MRRPASDALTRACRLVVPARFGQLGVAALFGVLVAPALVGWLVAPALAASTDRHAPTRAGTAGFREAVAARVPAGRTPEHMGEALPSQGATRLGGAFVGRDGRLYVWDDEWSNVKIVAFAPDGRTRLSVTPQWPVGGDSLHVVSGDADSSGRVFLLCTPTSDRVLCRVYAWKPGESGWNPWELPRQGGSADVAAFRLPGGARVRTLADGRVVLVADSAGATARGLLIWRPGGPFESVQSLEMTETPELAAPRVDRAGHRIVHDGAADLAIADSTGHVLASMAAPAWPQWKHVQVDDELYEPQGTVLAVQTTSRGLVIRRLVPEIAGVPILPVLPMAPDSLPAHHAKPPRSRRHESSSITG